MNPPAPAPLISAVTYTYNRAAILERLLESLCEQDLGCQNLVAEEFELLVVDNASSDGTQALVESFGARAANLRCIFEPRQGTSYARNRGWQEARGEYVAFIDDDGRAPPGWLAAAAGIIRSTHPDVLGGPVLPDYAGPKPAWFRDAYATIGHGDLPRRLEAHEYFSGSNLILRRQLLQAIGGFAPHLGHHGARLGYGEEANLQRRLRQQFPQAVFYYDPALFNYHLFRPEKFSLLWQARAKFALGRYNYLAFDHGREDLKLRHLLGALAMPWSIAYQLSLGVLLRSRRRYPRPQNYFFEVVLNQVRIFGRLCERLCQRLGCSSLEVG